MLQSFRGGDGPGHRPREARLHLLLPSKGDFLSFECGCRAASEHGLHIAVEVVA